MHTLSESRVDDLMTRWAGKKIAVIGDLMLDRYFWGSVVRVSPEAPVPVVDVEHETFHLGGASNVANNLKSLGAMPLMLGVIGDDNSGKLLLDIVRGSGLETTGIIADAGRPTTVKTRVIGNNQQIVRLDREVKTAVDNSMAQKLQQVLEEHRDTLAGIILQDYNKGVITPQVIQQTIAFATAYGIPVHVDPKFQNFFEYRGVTLFKPNRKETQDAIGFALHNDDDVIRAGKVLLERLGCSNVLITLGSRGMMLFECNGDISSVATKARHVADVSGAGDTVIATIAAAIAGGAGMREAAALANVAAGVVCAEPGIIAIGPQPLREAVADAAAD